MVAFQKPKKTLSPRSFWQSLSFALRGLMHMVRTTPHAWVQMCFFFAVAIGGFWVHLSPVEFALALTVAGFVLALEAVNTAFEIDIDLTSPEYHAMARDAKDVAAGAVLIASFVAIIVNVIIFYPHISMYL